MAAMDGNPGGKIPREIDARVRPTASVSREDDSPGVAPGGYEAEIGRPPARRPNRGREISSDAGHGESKPTDSERNSQDSQWPDPANFVSGEEVLDPADTPLSPLTEAIWAEETQLSSPEGVSQGMGTIALERIPLDEQRARQAAARLPAGLAGDLAQMTDAEIMQRAGAGDEACLEFLIAKYRRPIISFMQRMVHNQAVAEELAQEVFLRVYRARATYRAEARFSTWLYRIASNMAINHARDTKYERASASIFLDQTDEDTGVKPDVADLRPLAEQDMLQDERMRRIREHVMALPERQRMAVVMHKYQDMDYKQIGAVLKLSESATKSLLFRAYQTLREKLKEFA
jgi:RNA polymerase sigma-70 factor, ECF subfamily